MAHILVAEDEPVSREFLHEALLALGHRADNAADGESALRHASEQYFDLLLLDLNLPLLRGPDVLAALRSRPEAACSRSPAIALSAGIDPRLAQELRQNGFAAVAGKPIGVEALGQLILQVLPGASHSAVAGLQDWDDAAALRATGGARPIVQSLRELMLRDLPAQRALILQSISAGTVEPARGELHRLRAACGFCGAERLLHTLDPLEHALAAHEHDGIAVAAFSSAVDQLLDGGRG